MRALNVLVVAVVVSIAAVVSQADAAPITSGRGPGGVGLTNGTSNLRLWLDAGDINNDNGATNPADGATMNLWRDKSGYTQNAALVGGATTPNYDSSGAGLPNNRAVVDFNDATDHFRVTNFVTNVLSNKPLTAFVVAEGTGSFASNSRTGTVPRFYLLGSSFSYHEPNQTIGPWSDPAGFNAHSYMQTGTQISGWIDGGLQGTTAKNQTNITGSLEIPFVGTNKIAEMIVYDRALNAVERIVTDNALAAKYDLTLSANDFYAGDSSTNGHHDWNVFGVGRVDVTNQLTNTGAAGFGIEVTGGLGDNEWVLAGHGSPTNSVLPTIEGAFDEGKRWERNWYVDATGTTDLTFAFDFSDAGLSGDFVATDEFTLLYSSSSSYIWQTVDVEAMVTGDTVTFTMTNFNQDGFYTLGINAVVTPIPEPSTFTLLGVCALGMVTVRRRRRNSNRRAC